MIRKVHRKWFEIWGEEQAQNKFLKGLLLILTSLLICFSVVTCHLSIKPPVLITISPKDTRLLAITDPEVSLLEQEIKSTLKKYMTIRHTWTPKTIEDSANKAKFYIQRSFKKKYRRANKNQIAISKKRNISQKMYVYDLKLDSSQKKAILKIDRILNISGVRSNRTMTFELKYIFGSRHAANPEGIYITSEKLINSLN